MSDKQIVTIDFAEFGKVGLFLAKDDYDKGYRVSIIAFDLNNSYTAVVAQVYDNLETAKACFSMFKSVLKPKK